MKRLFSLFAIVSVLGIFVASPVLAGAPEEGSVLPAPITRAATNGYVLSGFHYDKGGSLIVKAVRCISPVANDCKTNGAILDTAAVTTLVVGTPTPFGANTTSVYGDAVDNDGKAVACAQTPANLRTHANQAVAAGSPDPVREPYARLIRACLGGS